VVDHNARPNEQALADYLKVAAAHSAARFIVSAGHIHNYERLSQDGVTYLVSGGGGATPYDIDRTSTDLYQSTDFPNYHYVRFELRGQVFSGEMIRLEHMAQASPRAGKPRIGSKLPCSLDGLDQLADGGLRIAIQHSGLVEHEQRIVDT